MSALYYALGAVAKMNANMWRYRINFLPINVLVIAAMTFAAFGTTTDAIEGFNNSTAPQSVSVAQIYESPRIEQNYVSVTGLDIPVAMFEYGSKGANGEITSVEKSWSPLLDRANQRILLVQRGRIVPGGSAQEATITGMLRELNADVRKSLAAHNDSIKGVPVETRYMLVAGERPANSVISAIISVLLFAAVALFVIATINRNTIFRRANLGSPLSKVKSVAPLKVGATGTFAFEQNGKVIEKRFIDMPAALTHLDNGNPVLLSNIDASNRFMGVKTSQRAGIWSIGIQAGSMRDSQIGFLYWGTARRPALRFVYTNPSGAKRQAIITADDIQMLDTAVALLTALPASQSAPAL